MRDVFWSGFSDELEKLGLSKATLARAAEKAFSRAGEAKRLARVAGKSQKYGDVTDLEGTYARRVRQGKKFQGLGSPAKKDFTDIKAPTGGHWLKGVKPGGSSAAAVKKTEAKFGIR
tara:strand:+ start:420 stop:770 length:351 start_codon:yes stop_codon:yes gene_type:complete